VHIPSDGGIHRRLVEILNTEADDRTDMIFKVQQMLNDYGLDSRWNAGECALSSQWLADRCFPLS
jgi:hypothetical protein